MSAFTNTLRSLENGYNFSRQLRAHKKEKELARTQNALMQDIGGILGGGNALSTPQSEVVSVPNMTVGVVPDSQAAPSNPLSMGGGAPQTPVERQNPLAPQPASAAARP